MIDKDAKRWIYSRCGGKDEPKDVRYEKAKLPPNLTPDLIRSTLENLRQDGCVSYACFVDSGNAGRTVRALVYLKDC